MTKLITEKERKHYNRILESRTSPIEAGINRVLVIQIREEDETSEQIDIPGFYMGEVKKVGSILMPGSSKERLKDEHETVKAVVVSVGPSTETLIIPFKPLDIVFVFPSVFETKMTFEDLDYFSYSQRDIVAVDPFKIEITYD